MRKTHTASALLLISLTGTLAACESPGHAKEQTVNDEVPPLGKVPELPEEVTAPSTKSEPPKPPPPPAPAPEPETVTETAPPPSKPPAKPAPKPPRAPAPKPPANDSPEIRIQLPPELRPYL